MVSARRLDFLTVVEEVAVYCSGDETEQNASCDGAKAGTLRASGTETGPQDQGEAMIWHDTPPTVAGTYWVKGRTSGEEWPMRLHEDGAFEGHPSEVQFGHRIPANDELAQIERERTALCEVATICMNTRAIMPEFREISDYTEVVDIIGAFLERLDNSGGVADAARAALTADSEVDE